MSAGPVAVVTTRPAPSPLGMEPSIGFGDRLGLGTPGHVAALREAGGPIRGIFAQQSIREMTRTGRSAETIMAAAVDALAKLRFTDPWSADGDHLKTPADIRRTMAAGFVMFTLDPSEEVDQSADDYDASTLAEKFAAAREFAPWFDEYRGQSVQFDSGVIEFDERTLTRAAVKYGRAIRRAISLAQCAEEEANRLDQPFEIELSIDETAHPTTLAEHYIIADQCRQAGVNLVSLAPRFIGDFEKGVDYKGDLTKLEASMRIHAEIARRLGPYKISLHSGSDKLSMYPVLARVTGGKFHVKTAGTSYLEALRVAAQHDPSLFREIIDFSRSRFDEDKASYHVSAVVNEIPAPEEVEDPVILERLYLDRWEDVAPGRGFTEPGRQILHCTFGSVITNAKLGPRLVSLLKAHPQEHCEILCQHFVRHLQPLNAG
ncbi:tagaturonate epimerase family protein [Lacipirellula sp.]|uniref:tagaturonate epimerase family protein n=1 Tax=Lacipirellula sp. TaxID=2691419 RepID=UPI003D11DE52